MSWVEVVLDGIVNGVNWMNFFSWVVYVVGFFFVIIYFWLFVVEELVCCCVEVVFGVVEIR